MTTAPSVRPVYLALPSSDASGHVVGEFVDHLALHPATCERLLLGVAEYSTFLHELAPLATPLHYAARVSVSAFAGANYMALFNGLAQLIEYDRYRLADQVPRLGRPVIVVVVGAAAEEGDDWAEAHRSLLHSADDDPGLEPTLVAVCVRADRVALAKAIAFPPHRWRLSGPARVGDQAAAAALEAIGPLGDRCVSQTGSTVQSKGIPT